MVMKMNKKEIQRKRMISYFVEATNKIIEEEGIEEVTIRKVADLAGYNSATLYNYFDNLDHLLFFACMKYLREYVNDLPVDIESKENSIEKYLLIWKAFSSHSFKHPKIYYRIFFDKYSNSLNDSIKRFYDIFPEELGKHSNDILPMLLGHSIYDRNMYVLENCLRDYNLNQSQLEEVNEMNILIYQGMLTRFINSTSTYDIDEAVERLLTYIRKIINSYLK